VTKALVVTKAEQGTDKRFRHGQRRASTYRSWEAAKARCENSRNIRYPLYGGRGIRMCQSWSDDFRNFLRDMGERPVNHSLDRIDNDGPYSPDNCKWSTRVEQGRNTTRNHLLTIAGETLTVSDWSRRSGINPRTICKRLKRGWAVERAVTEALR